MNPQHRHPAPRKSKSINSSLLAASLSSPPTLPSSLFPPSPSLSLLHTQGVKFPARSQRSRPGLRPRGSRRPGKRGLLRDSAPISLYLAVNATGKFSLPGGMVRMPIHNGRKKSTGVSFKPVRSFPIPLTLKYISYSLVDQTERLRRRPTTYFQPKLDDPLLPYLPNLNRTTFPPRHASEINRKKLFFPLNSSGLFELIPGIRKRFPSRKYLISISSYSSFANIKRTPQRDAHKPTIRRPQTNVSPPALFFGLILIIPRRKNVI